MGLDWKQVYASFAVWAALVGVLGCELDECTDDPATEQNECSDIFAPGVEGASEEEESFDEVNELAGCDQHPDICDAEMDTVEACATDSDCDGAYLPCEGDGVCDIKCTVGADPDCGENQDAVEGD